VSAALSNAEAVHLERKPRMADFAVGATAMEECFGWEPDSFVEIYSANRQQASETLRANEPIAEANQFRRALKLAEKFVKHRPCQRGSVRRTR
jgi:hypothetical protein